MDHPQIELANMMKIKEETIRATRGKISALQEELKCLFALLAEHDEWVREAEWILLELGPVKYRCARSAVMLEDFPLPLQLNNITSSQSK